MAFCLLSVCRSVSVCLLCLCVRVSPNAPPNDLKKLKQNEIEGGYDIASSAKIFMDVLNDNCTEAQKNVILANAALAIKTISSKNITECLSIARESLESKKALNSFNKLLSISK